MGIKSSAAVRFLTLALVICDASIDATVAQPGSRQPALTAHERTTYLRAEDHIWDPVAAVLEPRVRQAFTQVMGEAAATAALMHHSLDQPAFLAPQMQPLATALVGILHETEVRETLWSAFIQTPQGRDFASDPQYHVNFLTHSQQLSELLERLVSRNQLAPQIVDAFLPRPDTRRSVERVSQGERPESVITFRDDAAREDSHRLVLAMLELHQATQLSSPVDSESGPARQTWDHLFIVDTGQLEGDSLFQALSSSASFQEIRSSIQEEVRRLLRTEVVQDQLLSRDPTSVLAGLRHLHQHLQTFLQARVSDLSLRSRVMPVLMRLMNSILRSPDRAIRDRTHSTIVQRQRVLVESRFKIIEMALGGFPSRECTGGGLAEHPDSIDAVDAGQDLLADKIFTLVALPEATHAGSMATFRLQRGAAPLIGLISGMRSLTDGQRRGVLSAVFSLYPSATILIGSADDAMDNSGFHLAVHREHPELLPAMSGSNGAIRLGGYDALAATSQPVSQESPLIPGMKSGGWLLSATSFQNEAQRPVVGHEEFWLDRFVSAWNDSADSWDRQSAESWQRQFQRRFEPLTPFVIARLNRAEHSANLNANALLLGLIATPEEENAIHALSDLALRHGLSSSTVRIVASAIERVAKHSRNARANQAVLVLARQRGLNSDAVEAVAWALYSVAPGLVFPNSDEIDIELARRPDLNFSAVLEMMIRSRARLVDPNPLQLSIELAHRLDLNASAAFAVTMMIKDRATRGDAVALQALIGLAHRADLAPWGGGGESFTIGGPLPVGTLAESIGRIANQGDQQALQTLITLASRPVESLINLSSVAKAIGQVANRGDTRALQTLIGLAQRRELSSDDSSAVFSAIGIIANPGDGAVLQALIELSQRPNLRRETVGDLAEAISQVAARGDATALHALITLSRRLVGPLAPFRKYMSEPIGLVANRGNADALRELTTISRLPELTDYTVTLLAQAIGRVANQGDVNAIGLLTELYNWPELRHDQRQEVAASIASLRSGLQVDSAEIAPPSAGAMTRILWKIRCVLRAVRATTLN